MRQCSTKLEFLRKYFLVHWWICTFLHRSSFCVFQSSFWSCCLDMQYVGRKPLGMVEFVLRILRASITIIWTNFLHRFVCLKRSYSLRINLCQKLHWKQALWFIFNQKQTKTKRKRIKKETVQGACITRIRKKESKSTRMALCQNHSDISRYAQRLKAGTNNGESQFGALLVIVYMVNASVPKLHGC